MTGAMSPKAKVIVASTVLLSFISFWRAAAIVSNDLASSAYYAGGIAEIFDVSGRNREDTQVTESLEWSPDRFQLRHRIHSDRSRNIRRLRRGAKSK